MNTEEQNVRELLVQSLGVKIMYESQSCTRWQWIFIKNRILPCR